MKSEFILLSFQVFGVYLAFASLWYFAGSGALWALLYKREPGTFHSRKVITEMPSGSQVLRELRYSCLTLITISLGWLAVWIIDRLQWGQFYWDIREHSLLWLVSSVLITIVLWDTWFYWTHRMMHSRLLFRTFHRTHHRSRVTSPLTGYSLDLPEAITYVLFLPLVTMIVPLHPVSISIFMIIQLVGNLAIHQGHEFMPARFAGSWCSYWISSPTSHAMHHYHFNGNYGFFFQYWDRLMGTCHPNYDEELHRQCTPEEAVIRSGIASQSVISE